jgi:threonine synthase
MSEPTTLQDRPDASVPRFPSPAIGVIARYRSWLPVSGSDPVITLGEGSTPLVPAQVLSEILDCDQRCRR